MRLIFMGSEALTEGFDLLGFETFPNATPAILEAELSKLLSHKEKALIFLEDSLFQHPSAILLRARSEAAGIIITEIPPLNAPDTYRPVVEELVTRVLGASALENKT